MNAENTYIAHYGIKGQKWGIRRFQDYDGHRTIAGRERYADHFAEYKAKREEKKLLVAAIKEEAKVLDSLYENREFKNLKDIPKIEGENTPSANAAVANPGYPEDGTVMNCGLVSVAMAMREKGFDVVANKSMDGFSEFAIESMFSINATFRQQYKAKTPEDLSNTFKSYGEGAYGIIGVEWPEGGGHFMFWKNEKGGFKIYDGQDNTSYGEEAFKYIVPDKTTISRLDWASPKPRVLSAVKRRN